MKAIARSTKIWRDKAGVAWVIMRKSAKSTRVAPADLARGLFDSTKSKLIPSSDVTCERAWSEVFAEMLYFVATFCDVNRLSIPRQQ